MIRKPVAGEEGLRTPNPRFWRPVLYQLSYTPNGVPFAATRAPMQVWRAKLPSPDFPAPLLVILSRPGRSFRHSWLVLRRSALTYLPPMPPNRLAAHALHMANASSLERRPLGDTRRPAPRHPLWLRSAGRARAAVDPAASSATLPHTRSKLFAQGHAGQSLRQLAAGPAWQLARPLRFSGAGRGIQDRGRSDRRTRGGQPVRLLRRTLRRGIPVRLRRRTRDRARRLSRGRARRPAADELSAQVAARRGRARSISWSRSTRNCSGSIHYVIRMEAGRPGAGRDAGAALGLVPRFGLAAGADPAAARPRRRASSPAI